MKRLALGILVLFVISFSNAYTQGVYVKLGGGYGLGLATQYMYNAGTSPAFDYKYGSFGEGINFQAGFGYNITPNIALELAGSYTLGKKFEHTSSSGGVNYKEYANSIFIMPSAIVKAPMKDITPYARFGMVLGIPTKYYESAPTPGVLTIGGTIKYKESGGLAMGIQGACGVDFKVAKKLGIFAEIFGIGMNYGPSTLENTENYAAIQPTVTYSESGSGINTAPTPRYSFSSFGMNVGLTFTFGK
ncbi:MAG: hypothetical protein ACOYN6_03835 [Ignavibacteria bacterium]